jgi:outer membrane protein TolC
MRSRLRSPLVFLLIITSFIAAASSSAEAKTYDLQQLLDLAIRGNMGLAASAQGTKKVEAQLSEARRSWQPTGEILSLLAPVPDLRCEPVDPVPPGVDPRDVCLRTNITETSTSFSGIFTRTELRLVQPLFTFGKISAGKEAATYGVAASKSQTQGVAAELGLNVRRAYYGVKLAREIASIFEEGYGYLDDAQKEIDKQLSDGTGDVTPSDRLRLRALRADIEARRLEVEKLGGDARAGLRALLGAEAPADLEVDEEPLELLEVPNRPLKQYEEAARQHRPEVNALANLAAAKRSLADLERRKQYPDLVLMGTATYARASSIDNPQNAFFNDPFNVASVGLAAAVRMPLDIGVRNARAAQVAADADETEYKRREALIGINFEVQRAYGALEEVKKRLVAVRAGERAAKAWITAISQNFATGLAEAKDFQDALVQFFLLRVRVLQAVFDHNVAVAALSRVTGTEVALPPKPPEAEEEEEKKAEETGQEKAEKAAAPAATNDEAAPPADEPRQAAGKITATPKSNGKRPANTLPRSPRKAD